MTRLVVLPRADGHLSPECFEDGRMAENATPPQNQIDQYQLVNCISTGSLTQIWEVKHIANQQQFAMKLLLPEHLKDKAMVAELKKEASIAKQLEHPNIVRIVEVSIGRDNAYFIMEYFRGGSLKGLIRNDHATIQGRAKKIMEACAQTFAFIHDKGWVHKDIKPDNILVTKAGDVRVIDFSLASKPTGMLTTLFTKKDNIVIQGTRTYLAPEVIQRQPLTFAADIYSLGILFYEILTGRAPFIMGNANDLLMAHVRDIPEKPSGYNINLTPELDQFIFKMIAKKPKDRFASMHEVNSALKNLKVFKEDPETYLRNKVKTDDAKFTDSIANTLDSRADAERTPEERAKAREEAAKTKAALRGNRPSALKDKEPAKPTPAKPVAPQPLPQQMQPMMQPQMMQPMMPQMPYPQQMGMPGMPMGYPQPGQYPGMPGMMPGQQYPGMPMPGMMPGQGQMPGMYPGQMPGMPMPGMPMPQAVPPAPRPLAPAPVAAPAPSAPLPTAPKPLTPKPVEEIPLMEMDELPDVM
jgi:eukaryotic-like serine/threonine-protein kinase